MSDDDEEDETTCPLCVEEMDLNDRNFMPCPCGYRVFSLISKICFVCNKFFIISKVCMWCWHHIRENLNGLCPACRTPYNADPHLFSAVDLKEYLIFFNHLHILVDV